MGGQRPAEHRLDLRVRRRLAHAGAQRRVALADAHHELEAVLDVPHLVISFVSLLTAVKPLGVTALPHIENRVIVLTGDHLRVDEAH
jgi:hypothetical protein